MTKAPLMTPVLIGGCCILMLSFAIRASFGMFQIPIAAEFGWPRADFSMAIAIQNLAWGIGQPIFGALAERFGDRRAIVLGALMYSAGLLMSSYATTPLAMQALEVLVHGDLLFDRSELHQLIGHLVGVQGVGRRLVLQLRRQQRQEGIEIPGQPRGLRRGGGGIGGIWPPIMRLRAQKMQRYMASGGSFNTLWMGHWHQLIQTPGMIVNGSLKGADEYSIIMGYSYEEPQQAFSVIAPDKGIVWQAPVFAMDRKAEGW